MKADLKILKMKVQWNESWDNDPSLVLLLNRLPEPDDFVFEEKRSDRGSAWFAENKSGLIQFFYENPKDPSGYCGRHFTVNTKTGAKILKGPWSSRSAVMTGLGFTPSTEVYVTADKESFIQGFTWYHGFSISLKALEAILPNDLTIIAITKEGETHHVVAMKDGRRKPNPETFYGKKDNNWQTLDYIQEYKTSNNNGLRCVE
jgi:hypothetical protein